MNSHALDRAILEAAQFIKQARVLRAALKLDKVTSRKAKHPRESGATRRASMDLTRALADLRQGR
jgi:hypothetical protein